MELAPGTEVDRYIVEKAIGRGGMAVVYRVRHSRLGTVHALKVLSLPSAAIQDRLLQEGRVQANLRHPNVVSVTDVIDVHGTPGLVMEFVDGPSLDRHLWKKKILAIEEADSLSRGIIAGVAAAHALSLVHRDLKPANILLTTNEKGEMVPKITDFGLAKILRGTGLEQANATRSGHTMGTPQYMSPEQIRNAKHVDERADVFSLGSVLYELVTGQSAFPGEDMFDVFTRITSGKYVPLRDLVPDVPQRIETAILGALEPDIDRRIQSANDLLAIWSGDRRWNSPTILEEAGQWQDEPLVPGGPPTVARLPSPAGRVPSSQRPSTTATMERQGATAAGAAAGAGLAMLALGGAALFAIGGFALFAIWYLQGGAATVPTPTPAPVEVAAPTPAPEPVIAPVEVPVAVEPVPVEPVPVAAPVPGVRPKPQAPKPAPAPLPAMPVPSTAPKPAPSDAPKPAGPPRGTVYVKYKNAKDPTAAYTRSAKLKDRNDKLYSPGEVPPGSYVVVAAFESQGAAAVGTVNVAAGQIVTVWCNEKRFTCAP